MTITLYLQKETLLRDVTTLQSIFKTPVDYIEKLRRYREPLNISSHKRDNQSVAIQVTAEEFALIGVFNGGI